MYDIEVDSSSHYVLYHNGLIVRNSRLYVEEMGQWPDPKPLDMMRATVRSGHPIKCGMRGTTNPGGSGHHWLKARYIDPAPKGMKVLIDPETEEEYMFIPARLEDNKILMENDPSYERRIMGVGSAALVRAWRWGEWDIVSGGFFDDIFRFDTHIIPPFKVPEGWELRRSFDWGSAKPASLGIWAISDGSIVESEGLWFPRGSVIRINEWYTCQKKGGFIVPNKGLKLSNQDLGIGIAKRSIDTALRHRRYENSRPHEYKGCVADPAIFHKHGGPSIWDQIRSASAMVGHRLYFRHADNSRVTGWQLMRGLIEEAAKEQPEFPGMWIFDTCTEWIRTVPTISRHKKNLDDVESEDEDHCADETRYLSASTRSASVRGTFVG